MTPTRVAVTGGSGFIGMNLVDVLLTSGADVESWDVAPPRNSAHQALWRDVDVGRARDVREAFARFQPTHVIHLAARTDLHGATVSDYAVNVDGAVNVLAVAEASESVERVVIASSRLVCRIGYQPVADDDYAADTPYGESKVLLERYVRSAELATPWVIVRPTSIWGPWFGTPYRDFFLAVARGRYVHPTGVAIWKSFGYVGNTAHQLLELCRVPGDRVAGRTLYLADYEPLEVGEFAESIRSALDRGPVRTAPLSLLRAIAAAGDALRRLGVKEPPLTRFRLRNLLTPMVHDLEPLRAAVGPVPYSTSEGVALTVSWLRGAGLA